MGLLDFNKLPINTLVGADWQTFHRITAGQAIGPGYRNKYRLTKAVCRLLSLLKPLQDRRYQQLLADRPLEHAPVFILGHWRSGTTFMHNVLSCDRHFGYNTTYQTVFPHLMMWGQPFFKKNMSWLMPDQRPTDNMELAVDLPQEEEFALTNMMPYTYYNFWFLPQRMNEYADKHLIPKGNLVEVRFEDYERHPFGMTEDIYRRLSLPGFDTARTAIQSYVDKLKGYQKNRYAYKPETVELVEQHWSFALRQWGYSR